MSSRRLVLAIAVAMLVAALWAALPPRATTLDAPVDPLIARGAIHVHTSRSDGTGSLADVARAAASAGLQFVILTDHGDGTAAPEPPQVLDGVLVIDAVEISTSGGHLLALGLPRAPYRLAGEPRDVIEDVHRLGGFAIAAHVDSPKADLRWRDWQAPFDGLEWLNADSQWRDERRGPLARAIATYWLRGPEAIAALFDRPATALARWDALARRRPVVAIAGHDAHARVGTRGNWEPGEDDRSLRLPSYESAFRSFAVRVRTERPLGASDAAADAALLLDAIRAGRVYTLVDAIAGPALLDFTAATPVGTFRPGATVPAGDVTMRAEVRPMPADARLTVLRDGEPWETATGRPVSAAVRSGDRAAAYRVEVHLPGAPGTPPVPWIVSNPIYVGLEPAAAAPPRPPARWSRPVWPPAGAATWQVEQHPTSTAALERVPGEVPAWRLRWRLADGARAGQYVALVAPVGEGALARVDRVSFTIAASAPMRLSVQVRIPDGQGLRWQRSIHAGPTPRPVTVFLDDMSPVEAPPGTRLDTARVDSLLFVVDTVNASPGASGAFEISEVRWEGTNDD